MTNGKVGQLLTKLEPHGTVCDAPHLHPKPRRAAAQWHDNEFGSWVQVESLVQQHPDASTSSCQTQSEPATQLQHGCSQLQGGPLAPLFDAVDISAAVSPSGVREHVAAAQLAARGEHDQPVPSSRCMETWVPEDAVQPSSEEAIDMRISAVSALEGQEPTTAAHCPTVPPPAGVLHPSPNTFSALYPCRSLFCTASCSHWTCIGHGASF